MWKEPLDVSANVDDGGRDRRSASVLTQIERPFTGVSSYAVFCFDSGGAIRTWNPGVQTILGYGREQFVGLRVETLFTEDDRQRGIPQVEMQRAALQGEASDDRWHVRQDGSRVFVAGFVAPIRDDAEGVRGFLKLIRDRTDLVESSARLRERRDQAEAENREKDAFVAVLAHELRQPLGAILGWARLGANSRFAQDRAADVFGRIRRSAETTMRFVNDLLEVSRISSGKLQLTRERTDLAALIEDTVPELAIAAEGRGVSVTLHVRRPCVAEADPLRLRQVIGNLVGNAMKYTPRGGSIRVTAYTDGREVVLIVSDTGIGIGTQDLPHIFDRFRQSRAANDRQTGLGLGLWVVKEVVHRHGGTITAASDGEGRGATFTVRLPCTADPT
jgi:two-component system CheB/CheR fusion protein